MLQRVTPWGKRRSITHVISFVFMYSIYARSSSHSFHLRRQAWEPLGLSRIAFWEKERMHLQKTSILTGQKFANLMTPFHKELHMRQIRSQICTTVSQQHEASARPQKMQKALWRFSRLPTAGGSLGDFVQVFLTLSQIPFHMSHWLDPMMWVQHCIVVSQNKRWPLSLLCCAQHALHLARSTLLGHQQAQANSGAHGRSQNYAAKHRTALDVDNILCSSFPWQ